MSNQNEDYDEELAKAAECKKKACKKFKAMTMKAGKKRKRAAASFFFAASYVLKNLEVTFFAAHFFAACEEGS